MPMTNANGDPITEELPGTIRRSSAKAQRTFAKAHDSAAEQYGEGKRAHRVAYAALKHTHEKKGDHWVAKGHKGPSDPRAASPKARQNHGKTYGGVDLFGSTKHDLLKRAADLGVRGRSTCPICHDITPEIRRRWNARGRSPISRTRRRPRRELLRRRVSLTDGTVLPSRASGEVAAW